MQFKIGQVEFSVTFRLSAEGKPMGSVTAKGKQGKVNVDLSLSYWIGAPLPFIVSGKIEVENV